MPAGARNAALLSTLDSLTELSPDAVAALSTLACVPTPEAGLAAPSALFDPRKAELSALLHPGRFFPADLFREPAVRSSLAIVLVLDLHLKSRLMVQNGSALCACHDDRLACAKTGIDFVWTSYPGRAGCRVRQVLDAMVRLGMRNSITLDVLMEAGRSLDATSEPGEQDTERALRLLVGLSEAATQGAAHLSACSWLPRRGLLICIF